jgi:hypothetical protein
MLNMQHLALEAVHYLIHTSLSEYALVPGLELEILSVRVVYGANGHPIGSDVSEICEQLGPLTNLENALTIIAHTLDHRPYNA